MERVFYIPFIDEIVVWTHVYTQHKLVVDIDQVAGLTKEYEIIYLGEL